MVLVNKQALKYALWAGLFLLGACSDEELNDLMPGEPVYATEAYFIDATLVLSDSMGTIRNIELYADLNPQTPEGRNDFLVVEGIVTTEVYTVFYNDSIAIDTGLQEGIVLDNSSLIYGSASYRGVGFCFYLPTPAPSSSPSIELEDILQPGQTLSLGQAPGMVEIGYFKNHSSALDRPDRGLVTTTAESADGYLEILEVSSVQSGFGDTGYQVTVEFSAPMEHQLGQGQGGLLSGQARVFIPKP
jgi:hypothetical protein